MHVTRYDQEIFSIKPSEAGASNMRLQHLCDFLPEEVNMKQKAFQVTL